MPENAVSGHAVRSPLLMVYASGVVRHFGADRGPLLVARWKPRCSNATAGRQSSSITAGIPSRPGETSRIYWQPVTITAARNGKRIEATTDKGETMQRPTYTIRQAAEALDVDPRTIRRRIKDGALSATLAQRGRQQVRVIDGAELARFAQAEGYAMGTPAEGQAVTITAATVGNQTAATSDNQTTGPCPTCEGLRAALATQERLIQAHEAEVAFLREQLRLLTTRAMPPAEPRPSWWARLTGRRQESQP